MAASELRTRVTGGSIHSFEKHTGGHEFEIKDYSYLTDLDCGYIKSDRFTVGDHDFCIRYYPEGRTGNGEDCKDYVGVELHLMGDFTMVRLEYEFRLADDQAPTKSTMTVLTAENSTCGTDKFMKKSDLRRFLWNDSIKIHCYVTVIKESQLKKSDVSSNPVVVVEVPPSNLSSDLKQLLSPERKDGDIMFKVKTDVFRAHKLILDIRCPALLNTTVTQAQLDGQTVRDRRTSGTDNTSTVVIQDMEPLDFKALLHFIYTDSLPKQHRNEEMATSLLPAADKYDLKRMKLYCGNILSNRPTVDTVATTIALAHMHHCTELKAACIKYINSSRGTRDDVLSSEGYMKLRDTCPAVAVEIWESSDRKKGFNKRIERQQDPEEQPAGRNHHGEGKS